MEYYDDEDFSTSDVENVEEELYETHKFTVDANQSLIRIDRFLLTKLPKISRSKLQEAIAEEYVFVNDKPVKASYRVKPGDVITVSRPEPPCVLEIIPEDIPLDIIYEDHEIVVINKPAGLVVHPGYGNWTGTLVNALAFRYGSLPTAHNGEDKPGLVHRIDKDTSGLLVVAKTTWAMAHLAKQFFEHSIERTYYALVWGELKEPKGTIRGNIGRSASDRRMRQVYDEDSNVGKPAVTHYEVIQSYRYVSLVKCKLETGRTHQIRVHFRHIGHPLFNDSLYGGDIILCGERFSKYKAFVENCFEIMPRQALHAKSLGFVHPTTQQWMQFECDLPEDFRKVLECWENYVKYN
ncbi:MAG: RluA family pseudouridine synthase [Cytophagales bacterium]|nr:RluA family pseudouridine synthase [Cytophagales bacterium]MDW8384517.1 RluA family pseudouridine synthase [Flammeovirgaceae bacterium]